MSETYADWMTKDCLRNRHTSFHGLHALVNAKTLVTEKSSDVTWRIRQND
jgi:hypothetical protein